MLLSVLHRCVLPVLLACSCGTASAQSWPSRPIRFILPFAPGGVADITARIMSQKMSENIGQPIVVENRPGAGMIVSAQAALQTEPDGHMMIVAGNGTAISTSLFKSLPFDVLRDFAQLSTLAYFDLVMVTGPESRFKSAADVIAFARANPGKLNIGTISIGSTQNLTAELFKSAAGIDAQTIGDFERRDKRHFGIEEGTFVFLFSFHMNSVMERKNPLGLIRAFRRAFRPEEPVTLVVKTMFGHHRPAELQQLRDAAAGARIQVIDETYSAIDD